MQLPGIYLLQNLKLSPIPNNKISDLFKIDMIFNK